MARGSELRYQTGFGNELHSEALAGAIPTGQNSPQRVPYGLFSELISGTTFTAPRRENRRTYVFRIRPSVGHGRFRPIDMKAFLHAALRARSRPEPDALERAQMLEGPQDFIDGMTAICGTGTPELQTGMAFHVYRATRSMRGRAFSNADGDLLLLPQAGGIRVVTELGWLEAVPSEVVLVPRGLKFRVELLDDAARGFVCENFGAPFQLPELGPIGSNGLANAYDFLAPVAAFEDSAVPVQLVHKYGGQALGRRTRPFALRRRRVARQSGAVQIRHRPVRYRSARPASTTPIRRSIRYCPRPRTASTGRTRIS